MLAENLQDVFQLSLELAFDCELHLVEHLPKMANAASSSQVRSAFELHLDDAKAHQNRLEQIFARLNRASAAEHNPVIRAIAGEGEKLIKHIESSPLLDAVLIMHGSQMAHYQTALYGSLAAFARTLNHNDEARLLEQSQNEARLAIEALKEIGAASVYREAAAFQNTPHIFPLL